MHMNLNNFLVDFFLQFKTKSLKLEISIINKQKLKISKKNIKHILKNTKLVDLIKIFADALSDNFNLNNLLLNKTKNYNEIINNNLDKNINNIKELNKNLKSKVRIIFFHIFEIKLEKFLLVQDKFALDVFATEQYLQKWKKFFKNTTLLIDNVPVDYIIGYKEFYEHNFFVNKNTLIPRQDSEILVDYVIKDLEKINNATKNCIQDQIKPTNIFEFGTGSGCLIISILDFINKKLKNIKSYGIGIDISKKAIKIAKKNQNAIKIDNLSLLYANWNKQITIDYLTKSNFNYRNDILLENKKFQKEILNNILEQKFDIIIANPPYIDKSEKEYMSKSTLIHEPKLALFSKKNGMQDYITILQKHRNLIHKNTILYFELGFLSYEKFIEIINFDNFYKIDAIYKDYQGINRVAKLSVNNLDN